MIGRPSPRHAATWDALRAILAGWHSVDHSGSKSKDSVDADGDGDGEREVHCNTMEGLWTGARTFLDASGIISVVHDAATYLAIAVAAEETLGTSEPVRPIKRSRLLNPVKTLFLNTLNPEIRD